MTRRAVALLLAALATGLALSLGGSGPAAAHNNRTVFAGPTGPYDLVASVADVERGPEVGLLVEVAVRTRDDRRPVDDASVTVAAVAPDRRFGARTAERFGGTHRLIVPGGDVASWDLDVTVSGPGGDTRLDLTVPGPSALHDRALVDTGAEPPTLLWAAGAVVLAVALAVGGVAGPWRAVQAGGVVLLVASSAVVAAGAWSGSSLGLGPKALALLPSVVAAGALVVGFVLTGRGRGDAPALVFAGAAGLAVVVGWVERAALADRFVASGLAPDLTRAGVTVALGCGVGLALQVVVRSRSAIAQLVGGRS